MSVQQCQRCLYTSLHPFGITFDSDGICSGCLVHEEKNTIAWHDKWEALVCLTKSLKTNSNNQYDCIVPVEGNCSSFYTVHLVKKLGLKPLLVHNNKYFNTPLGIENLAKIRIKFDCDILIQNVNPVSVKKITRATLRRFGSLYWPCIAGQTAFPVQTAARMKIPLIIWGAQQGVEQVGMFSHDHEVEMTRRYRKEHDLMGYEADDLLSLFDVISEADIWQYRYPSFSDISSVGIRGIYLSNYVRWDPKSQNEEMIQKYGVLTSKHNRTFNTYENVDCFNYMGLHDTLKNYKNGYSKVTDHVCQEIRHGRMSRNEAIHNVQFYQAASTPYLQQVLEWLGVDEGGLGFLMDQHRNPMIWRQESPNNWKRIALGYENNFANKPLVPETDFIVNATLERSRGARYMTFGKGMG